MNFETVTLGEIAEFTNGGAWSDKEYVDVGIPVVRVTECPNGTVDLTNCKYLPEASLSKYAKHMLIADDLVIATVGSHPSQPKSVVGRPIIIPSSADGALLNQNAVRIRPANNRLDKKFLGYLGKSSEFQHYIVACAKGSANQVRMAIGLLKEMPVRLPAFVVQQKVASILSVYDDLIENNTQRIKILEEMAQAIYKEWFVNFRFPGHKKVTMVQSHLGMIPQGWEMKNLRDTANKVADKYFEEKHNYLPLLDLARIPKRSLAISGFGLSNEITTSRIIFQKGDVLFGAIRPYFHKVVFAPCQGVTNVSVFVIRPNSQISSSFLFCLLFSDDTVRWANQHTGGTKMPVIGWDVFSKMQVTFPPSDLQKKFDDIVRPILDSIAKMVLKNLNLRRTRDLLLPKLISGEIDVSKLEIESLS